MGSQVPTRADSGKYQELIALLHPKARPSRIGAKPKAKGKERSGVPGQNHPDHQHGHHALPREEPCFENLENAF